MEIEKKVNLSFRDVLGGAAPVRHAAWGGVGARAKGAREQGMATGNTKRQDEAEPRAVPRHPAVLGCDLEAHEERRREGGRVSGQRSWWG